MFTIWQSHHGNRVLLVSHCLRPLRCCQLRRLDRSAFASLSGGLSRHSYPRGHPKNVVHERSVRELCSPSFSLCCLGFPCSCWLYRMWSSLYAQQHSTLKTLHDHYCFIASQGSVRVCFQPVCPGNILELRDLLNHRLCNHFGGTNCDFAFFRQGM